MAKWNHDERKLEAKLVYYGPALGGKTTTLCALHRLADPETAGNFVSIRSADDATLLFDLLPFDLAGILGYRLSLQVFTVPGQIRNDTTRKMVLADADALVFVADSSVARKQQNVWSLQNLRMNMRAVGLDARLPIVYQWNKRDVPGAAPVSQVAGSLGAVADDGHETIAIRGHGVLDPFVTACKAMLERIVAGADETTSARIDAADLDRDIRRAFRPWFVRETQLREGSSSPVAQPGDPIVLDGTDLLECAVRSCIELGIRLSARGDRDEAAVPLCETTKR